VLVYAPDRLSRRYAYQILLIEEFGRTGVETLFIRSPRTITAEDQLLLRFQGMIAEYERAQIPSSYCFRPGASIAEGYAIDTRGTAVRAAVSLPEANQPAPVAVRPAPLPATGAFWRKQDRASVGCPSWRRQQAISLAAADRAQIISLGKDLPKLWDAASVVERKQILRLVVKEVVLDQRPESGQVWIRVIWQTGAVSEHKVRRNVSSYRNYADVATLEARVRDLVVARKMDREIARALNADGLLSAHGRPFSGGEVHLLRKRWNIPTVKINQTEHNPQQWPDGTYSVQGAAEALSVSTQTVFKWLQKGRLSGHQITKGMPWQINLSNTQIVALRTQIRRTTLSKKEAS